MAKFCSECGTAVNGAKFCPECGHPTGAQAPRAEAPSQSVPATTDVEEERVVWEGTPDPVLSPVAAKTTKYEITNERIRISSGLLGRSTDSLDLFRIQDVRVEKSITQRARGRGDLHITSTDDSTPTLTLEAIEKPDEVAETLRRHVTESRRRHGFQARETM